MRGKRKWKRWGAAPAVPLVKHLATYGEQGADDVPTACGIKCSTWDKPLQYVWETDKTTCPACLAATSNDNKK